MTLIVLLFILFLIFYAIFVMGDFSLSRFNSYAEDENSKSNNLFLRLSREISTNFRKYETVFLLGKFISFVILQFLFLGIYTLWFYHISNFNLEFVVNTNFLLLITLETAFIMFVILFGNMIPFLIARSNIVSTSLSLSLIISFFYYVFYPLIIILRLFYNFFEKFFGLDFNKEEKDQNIQDEVKYLIEESSKLGELEESERDIIENALEFSDTYVKNIMTPRNKISAIDIDDSLDIIVNFISEEGYSRYPVYRDSIDNVIGILNVKDFFKNYLLKNEINLLEIIRKPVLVIEDEQIDNLLKIMKSQKVHIVIAKDQFTGTSGLITMEDILEELVGEINDEYDEEQKLSEKISDIEYKINSVISIDELNEHLVHSIPESDDYESFGGYLLYITGTIPDVNQIIEDDFYIFTILKRTKRKIELVKLEIKNNDN